MKKVAILAISLFTAIAASSNAFADTTRAQVVSELQQLEAAGYQPGADDPNYPAGIQAAEQKIAGEHLAQAQTPVTSSEGSNGGTVSMSGSGSNSNSTCVGPVSFCNPYSGS